VICNALRNDVAMCVMYFFCYFSLRISSTIT
jgi:hypothetical protein